MPGLLFLSRQLCTTTSSSPRPQYMQLAIPVYVVRALGYSRCNGGNDNMNKQLLVPCVYVYVLHLTTEEGVAEALLVANPACAYTFGRCSGWQKCMYDGISWLA